MASDVLSKIVVTSRRTKRLVDRIRRQGAIEMKRLYLRSAPHSTARSKKSALSELTATSSVLILCHGNVCRSPMAERYLASEARRFGLETLEVQSAGFIDRGGRTSPELAVETAREFGVDLSDHRSTVVTPDLLAWSDLVFLMDVKNYWSLQRRYQDTYDAYLLRSFGDGRTEIADPINGDRDTFRSVYGQIAHAIDGFVYHLTEASEDSLPTNS